MRRPAPGSAVLACGPMAALTSFYEWLTKQSGLRTPLGAWAKQVAKDPAFPRDVSNVTALLDYVKGPQKGSGQALALARVAFQSYERHVRPPVR